VAGDRAVGGLGRALPDGHGVDDATAALSAPGRLARAPHGPPGPQVGGELLAEDATGLDESAAVDRLGRHLKILLARKVRASHPEICSGDHSSASLPATSSRSRGTAASLQGLGRRARSHARSSARAARYRWRPPWRATSRLMLDGARWSRPAILRSEAPSASPREISSRSLIVSTRGERRRTAGTYPPLEATTPWIEPGCLPSARPISLSDSPASTATTALASARGSTPAVPAAPSAHLPVETTPSSVLHRPVEPKAPYVWRAELVGGGRWRQP